MRRVMGFTLGAVAMVALAAPGLGSYDEQNDANRGNRTIELVDDCDPDDPAWAPVGCLQNDGDVTSAEFGQFLRSPLYDNIPPAGLEPGLFLVGHPSWRNDPSHVVIEQGKALKVRNIGGRPHTFTPVAQFGGGVVAPLNVGTQLAPGCVNALRIEAGDSTNITATGEGIQRFQCCFHPWMRATVRVVSHKDH